MSSDSTPPGELAYLPVPEVARRKGCTGQAVRNAIERGDLRAVRFGPAWAVADDEQLAAWSVKETGGRLHKSRPPKSEGER